MTDTKPSEVFDEAVKKKTRQIKGHLADGLGGYCAKGLFLRKSGDYEAMRREHELIREAEEALKMFVPAGWERISPLVYLNDREDWDFAHFRDELRKLGH